MAGARCQIGALSFVPKFATLEPGAVYVWHPRGEEVNYHVEGQGPVLLMVPGLDGTALLFYRQIPRLATRFRVVSFPLPDDPTSTMETLIADLESVIDEVSDDEPVFLMGESFGGRVELELCVDASESSSRSRHPQLLSPGTTAHPHSVRTLSSQAGAVGRDVDRPAFHRVSFAHVLTPVQDDLAEFHERSKSIGRQGYIRRLEILESYDVRGPFDGDRDPDPPARRRSGPVGTFRRRSASHGLSAPKTQRFVFWKDSVTSV